MNGDLLARTIAQLAQLERKVASLHVVSMPVLHITFNGNASTAWGNILMDVDGYHVDTQVATVALPAAKMGIISGYIRGGAGNVALRILVDGVVAGGGQQNGADGTKVAAIGGGWSGGGTMQIQVISDTNTTVAGELWLIAAF